MEVLWPHNYSPTVPNAGVFMFAAAKALNRRGVEPHLLYVGDLRSPYRLSRARALIREAAQGVDLVHTQYGSAVSWAAAAIRDRPLVMSLRGSDWTPAFATGVGRVHSRMSAHFTRRALPHYDLVIAVSHKITDEVLQYRPATKVLVAPDPIDLGAFVPRNRQDARRRLRLSTEAKYVLFTTISRENPLKRLPLAARSVAIAKSHAPQIEFLVASDFPHEEMPYVVAAADVALCTSVAEGWPNSIKEALACNIPVVSTDISDLGRIAALEEGCSIVDADPEAIAAAIVAAVESADPMRGEGLRQHVTSMGMDRFADTLLRAYEDVARPGGPTRAGPTITSS